MNKPRLRVRRFFFNRSFGHSESVSPSDFGLAVYGKVEEKRNVEARSCYYSFILIRHAASVYVFFLFVGAAKNGLLLFLKTFLTEYRVRRSNSIFPDTMYGKKPAKRRCDVHFFSFSLILF